ncbi:MAG: response regulator [Candidatus Hydrogenedentes bacterium]|nr:response regulator [Candidatus Hydrogenedentota bacterium]
MDKKEAEFLRRLRATFQGEAEDHLRELSSGLIALEKAESAQERTPLIESVFRAAHSLKGAARSVTLPQFEQLCQSIESVFSACKQGQAPLAPELYDALHQAVDHLRASLLGFNAEQTPQEASTRQLARALDLGLKRTEALGAPKDELTDPPLTGPAVVSAETTTTAPETVRIPASRLNSLLLQTEELVGVKLTAAQRLAELQRIVGDLTTRRREWAKRDAEQAGDLPDTDRRLAGLLRVMERDHWVLEQMVDGLLQDMKQALMLPFASLFEVLPKLVRDLARDQGKEIDLQIRGEDVAIDRRILEEIKSPLIHLIRNCVDHGIEKPEERARQQKPAQGSIKLSVIQQDGSHVSLIVKDDGRGIDTAGVLSAALKAGAVPPEAAQQLSEQEKQSLVFQSGVTTSPLITAISGRGLGLAIVQEKVHKVGGEISFDSLAGGGTTFRLRLPLTLATFRGVLVRVNEYSYVVPTLSVDRVVQVLPDRAQTVENRRMLRVNGSMIPLIPLAHVLRTPETPARDPAGAPSFALIIGAGAQRIALEVHEVLGEQAVLVKGFERQLSRVRNFAGAGVLGSGSVVPVLNVPDLLKSAIKSAQAQPVAQAAAEPPATRHRLLVAEDSITTRSLLKSILESSGYEVETAVDGMDALTQLRSSSFDLVVSDVDMPRMNGFDLTTRIRADKRLGETPVVLVTALESREDRERGIDVGANAYIVKSSFDQSNLLGVIQQLL